MHSLLTGITLSALYLVLFKFPTCTIKRMQLNNIATDLQCSAFRLLAVPLLFFAIFLSLPSQSYAKPKNVIFLNSYHVGYKWSDELYDGFLKNLQPVAGMVALHVEYLDMKRNFSEERYASLAESLAEKYKNIPIDLVVSSDDAAFAFIKQYGEQLFPGVPVFFCGTNYLEETALTNLPNFYGITEKAEIEKTFSTILKLRPGTSRIYIINDRTVTGLKVKGQIDKAIATFKHRIDFTIWDDLSMSDLITNVHNLPEDSVLFYTFFFRDNSGQSFEYNQSMRLIYRQCPVPIFGAWDFNLDLGLTGGMLTSGYQQGKAAAGLVTSWLEEVDLAHFPRITSSPNRFMFDHNQLDKFKIRIDRLPKDSIIINAPVSFFSRHKKVLITSGIFITMLLIVILFLTINIMRRKKAEKELRQSEENFRSIFYNANDGLYQATAEGRFIRVNPALATMLKFSSPEEVIVYFTDIDNQLYTSPDVRKKFLARHKNIGWAKGEHSLLCRDGSIIDVIENAHTVTGAQGEFLYYEGSITNMTEYKQTQELIAQTEKIISLGGVTAGIAHEIRSPLSTIVQGVQVVQGRIFDNSGPNLQCAEDCGVPLDVLRQYICKRDIDELLTNIYDSGKRAGVIIDDMLSFSKKSIGEFSLASMEKICNTAIELVKKDFTLNRGYTFNEIEIVKEIKPNLTNIYCIPSKIQQVIFNILKNGAEAMGDAETAIPRFIIRIYSNSKVTAIEIEDNGPGMSQELQQRIFDPFFTTKGRDKGTGLGLSVSYFIIKENHHGDLRVVSQPGKGTTFITELPHEQVFPPA